MKQVSSHEKQDIVYYGRKGATKPSIRDSAVAIAPLEHIQYTTAGIAIVAVCIVIATGILDSVTKGGGSRCSEIAQSSANAEIKLKRA
jgi:hypothetical protein